MNRNTEYMHTFEDNEKENRGEDPGLHLRAPGRRMCMHSNGLTRKEGGSRDMAGGRA